MSAEPDAKALGQRIAALYSEIAAGPMAGLPICNPALAVAAVGFRLHAGRAVGIVATPWFMNIVAADLPGFPPTPPARPGETRVLALPAGNVDLIVGELPGFGRLDAASLFSPMFEFADMAAAVETAEAAARELFEPPPPPPRAGVDRRAFLRGRMAEPEIAE